MRVLSQCYQIGARESDIKTIKEVQVPDEQFTLLEQS